MAYCKERIIFHEDKFSEAVNIACCLLQVNYFYDDQMEAVRNFFKGNDLFFSAHTAYRKSLIFQAIPIYNYGCIARPSY
jgi:hypothetical protein